MHAFPFFNMYARESVVFVILDGELSVIAVCFDVEIGDGGLFGCYISACHLFDGFMQFVMCFSAQ
jgi:hypothetical protein